MILKLLVYILRVALGLKVAEKLNVFLSNKRFLLKVKYSKVYLCFIHLDKA